MTERSLRRKASPMQRPAALVSYSDARAFVLARVSTLAPERVLLREALGKPLAEPVIVQAPVPKAPLAARQGIAVVSQELIGASPYLPVFLTAPPLRVLPGDPLPPLADAVIEEQAVTTLHGIHEIGQGAYPGEGAVLPGFDLAPGDEIAADGTSVTPAMLVALTLSGAADVAIRSPRIELGDADGSASAEAAWLHAMLEAAGCRVAAAGASDLRIVLCRDPSSIGPSERDIAIEGIALNPGRETRILWDGERVTFVFSTRFETSVAGFFALIAPALAAMTHRRLRLVERPLTAKIVSQVGLTDVVLLRATAHGYEPLAVGALSLRALAQADAVGVVGSHSEGSPAGAPFSAIALKDAYEPS